MRYAPLLIVVAMLSIAGCAKQSQPANTSGAMSAATEAASSEATMAAPPAGGKVYTITLNPLNGSNESGTATITDVAGGGGIHTSTIQVTLVNAPAGVNQPVNLYKGPCPPTTLPSVFLEPEVNGKMSHDLGGFGISNLDGLAIAVWSTGDIAKGKYVTCGVIKAK
jgi:hypothetical protein